MSDELLSEIKVINNEQNLLSYLPIHYFPVPPLIIINYHYHTPWSDLH